MIQGSPAAGTTQPTHPDSDSTNQDELTALQRDFVHLMNFGASDLQIASELFLSIRTVEKHRRNLHSQFPGSESPRDQTQ